MFKRIIAAISAALVLMALWTGVAGANGECNTTFSGSCPTTSTTAAPTTTTTEAPTTTTTEAATPTTEAPTTTTEAPAPAVPQFVPTTVAPTTTFVVDDPAPLVPQETTTTLQLTPVLQATGRLDCANGAIVVDAANLGTAGGSVTVSVDGDIIADGVWIDAGSSDVFTADLGPADHGRAINIVVVSDGIEIYNTAIPVQCVAGSANEGGPCATFTGQANNGSNNEGLTLAATSTGSGACQVACWFAGAAFAAGMLARRRNIDRLQNLSRTARGRGILAGGAAAVVLGMSVIPWITLLTGAGIAGILAVAGRRRNNKLAAAVAS